jgi:hypothetical protein
VEAWKVHKFGGSSVADAACMARVARIIEADPSTRKAVVLSACRGVTDALLTLVKLAETAIDVTPPVEDIGIARGQAQGLAKVGYGLGVIAGGGVTVRPIVVGFDVHIIERDCFGHWPGLKMEHNLQFGN